MRNWLPRILPIVTRILVVPVIVACGMNVNLSDQSASKPVVRPAVSLPALDADKYPGCTAPDTFKGIASESVVVTHSADVRRIPFDRAWSLNTNTDRADNVWVLGLCE